VLYPKRSFSVKHINSFFVEIIIVMFFFLISSAIIIQIFAKAHQQNLKTDELNQAVLSAQSICENFSSNGDIEKTLTDLYGENARAYISSNNVNLPLDNNWFLSAVDSKYYLKIYLEEKPSPAGLLTFANVTIFSGDDLLVEVDTSSYSSKKGDING